LTELAALRAALAAEHATIYGYGVAGAILRGPDRDYAIRALEAHTALRERMTTLVADLHGRPVLAEPAYQLPSPVSDRTAARALAAHLEEGGAGALWDLVAASTPGGSVRASAIGWLAQAAVRAAYWGARQALPGQPS
jgi:hypothetical protein